MDLGYGSLILQCQIRVWKDGDLLPDAIKLHLTPVATDEGTQLRIAGIVYAVEQEWNLGPDACPNYAENDMPGFYPATFATELRLMLPETMTTTIELPKRNETTTNSKKSDDKKTKEAPKNLVEFLQRYWIYLLPLLVLFIMPAAEPAPEPEKDNGSAALVKQGRVKAGPAAAGGKGSRNHEKAPK